MPTPRRFPPPWSVEEQTAFHVVRGHNGQALAYVYFEDESGISPGIQSRTPSDLLKLREQFA
jgi:hypothetical protein